MSSQISLPTCSSCFRPIMPNDKCVKFDCPDCNTTRIWRCESCRESARSYACNKCGFEGP
ncbi:MAG: DUF1610 domain-containing protein [Cenarchaeum sp. SB0665_bin_23]|nr:DUF1610 domain-containing protein [Cenarchaeum sp. SB0667_bin_13]MXY37844.1 DUF1610 domain-containing protein [Cenarchaeum sp. SB0664_bin_35]MXY61451.1 DUF1610 domain-containing protein [Cenarchaeum sp. SB0665_bin_23]MXZ94213.1 DUF1610 domain-containing protein [Cenarchaeum sp. SB0666_bin_15]MYB46412.1 DUF1610 domain-containing protein [Cenarchaeum sp. SB0662_bin_33]MYC80290.1 DUF1610 domain-containing protein [Cenarchaeum sp. SB0661_bin_35]MYD58261.1 DUF1610 domain-containing protein [Cen